MPALSPTISSLFVFFSMTRKLSHGPHCAKSSRTNANAHTLTPFFSQLTSLVSLLLSVPDSCVLRHSHSVSPPTCILHFIPLLLSTTVQSCFNTFTATHPTQREIWLCWSLRHEKAASAGRLVCQGSPMISPTG